MPLLPRASLPLSRRRVLAGVGLACTAILLPGRAAAQGAIPETTADGSHVLRARRGSVALRGPGQPPTELATCGGSVPGPLLRVRRGAALKVRLVNELAQPLLLHWHGVRLPFGLDGVPGLTQQPLAAGASADYNFTPPDAGTFWYTASPFSGTARGLHGVLIVEEADPPPVEREVVLVLDSWALAADGRLGGGDEAGTAEHLSVNGTPSLDIPVRPGERIRLRLVNASGNRLLAVRIERHRPVVVAVDGQPAEPFGAREGRVVLGPGNRTDICIDATLDAGVSAAVVVETATARATLARLVYTGAPAPAASRGEIAGLPAAALPTRMDFGRALRVDLPLDPAAQRALTRPRGAAAAAGAMPVWWTGEDAPEPFGPALFSIKRGRVAMLACSNKTSLPAVVHLHGHAARLLDNLDDGWKPFWLDTVVVMPAQTARLAFVADNPGRWLIEWQRLEQPDRARGAWFEVT